jgi:hypothetical protein
MSDVFQPTTWRLESVCFVGSKKRATNVVNVAVGISIHVRWRALPNNKRSIDTKKKESTFPLPNPLPAGTMSKRSTFLCMTRILFSSFSLFCPVMFTTIAIHLSLTIRNILIWRLADCTTRIWFIAIK